MPPTPKPPPEEQPAKAGEEATPAPEGGAAVKPGMTETEIRGAGLMVDVPFETGDGSTRLKYADLGKTWTPPDGWPDNAPETTTKTTEEID